MSTTLTTATTEVAVDHELFTLGHRNLVVTGFGQIALCTLVALAAHENVVAATLQWWWAFMLASGVVYWLEYWLFNHAAKLQEPDARLLRKWRLHRRTLQFVVGLGWGSLGFLLVPAAQSHNVIVMTAFVGMLGYAGAANTANDFVGFVVSGIAIVVVMVSQFPAVFGADATPITIMCVLYLVALISVVRNTQKLMRGSIRLRLANAVLARTSAEQAARAEKANREKSEFLAAASHDLRQPVHALLLLVEAYRQQEPLAARHPLLVHIAAAGQSISDLFNSLMELSRLESGVEKPVMVAFDLSELIGRVLLRVRPYADRKGIVLRRFEARGMDCATLCTDKVLLERILGNLLSNAIRYTSQGSVLLAVRQAHGGDGLWMEVWDTGVGIADEDQARIFSPYVQIGNQERDRSKGLGLGLAIVHHAASLLGLEVTLKSQLGRGSRFRVHVPRSVCVAGQVKAESQAARTALPVSVPQLAGRRVLLVDDDPMVLQAMQALLQTWQLDLRCTSRGDASVLAACSAEWVPECILCDFRMPGKLNGIELLDYILERFPEAVGILLTGEMVQSVQTQAEEAGYLVLFKPLDPAVLASTLSAVMSRRDKGRTT
jgi:signal transduction histidine kinase/CheY-like chemotaxis protein